MLNDILLVASIFITRIALPICVTFILGRLLERMLKREARPSVKNTWKLTERHVG